MRSLSRGLDLFAAFRVGRKRDHVPAPMKRQFKVMDLWRFSRFPLKIQTPKCYSAKFLDGEGRNGGNLPELNLESRVRQPNDRTHGMNTRQTTWF